MQFIAWIIYKLFLTYSFKYIYMCAFWNWFSTHLNTHIEIVSFSKQMSQIMIEFILSICLCVYVCMCVWMCVCMCVCLFLPLPQAAKWRDPPRDALDTMVLEAVVMPSMDTVTQYDYIPFDPVHISVVCLFECFPFLPTSMDTVTQYDYIPFDPVLHIFHAVGLLVCLGCGFWPGTYFFCCLFLSLFVWDVVFTFPSVFLLVLFSFSFTSFCLIFSLSSFSSLWIFLIKKRRYYILFPPFCQVLKRTEGTISDTTLPELGTFKTSKGAPKPILELCKNTSAEFKRQFRKVCAVSLCCHCDSCSWKFDFAWSPWFNFLDFCCDKW